MTRPIDKVLEETLAELRKEVRENTADRQSNSGRWEGIPTRDTGKWLELHLPRAPPFDDSVRTTVLQEPTTDKKHSARQLRILSLILLEALCLVTLNLVVVKLKFPRWLELTVLGMTLGYVLFLLVVLAQARWGTSRLVGWFPAHPVRRTTAAGRWMNERWDRILFPRLNKAPLGDSASKS